MDTVVTYCVRVSFPITLPTLTPSLALLFRPLLLFALFSVPDYAVALLYIQTRARMRAHLVRRPWSLMQRTQRWDVFGGQSDNSVTAHTPLCGESARGH